MAQLKVKNFGPIRSGLTNESNDGFFQFDGVTVFIGNQGTGKSTIAKLFSTLTWIEKALYRGDFNEGHLAKYRRFKKHLEYQNIDEYLQNDSYIHFKGSAYDLKYSNGALTTAPTLNHVEYLFPKVMYVPAERNFVSSVDRPEMIKRLPLPLSTFLEEYQNALDDISEPVNIPFGEVKLSYDRRKKKAVIEGTDYKINLTKASSGYQSFVPLFLVTEYLSRLTNPGSSRIERDLNLEEEKRIRKEIQLIMKNSKLTPEVKRIYLEQLSSRYSYSRFVNVVEEPEQNLYPTSQKGVLFDLLGSRNTQQENRLLITTHSPYIINYLTLAIKAGELIIAYSNKFDENDEQRLLDIVPKQALQLSSDVTIYQLDRSGSVRVLEDYKGLPSDENYLNDELADFNDDFFNLLELESKWKKQ